MIQAKAKERMKLSEGRGKKGCQNSDKVKSVDTKKELAKIAGVSHDTIEKAFIVFTKYIWWRNFSLLNQISFFVVLTK